MLQGYVMLYYMVRGESGRIVLEIDPSQKDELYIALTKDGLTLKDWFLQQAAIYLRERNQMTLFEGLVGGPKAYKVESKGLQSKTKSDCLKAKRK
jgi:hypothetical protein